MMYNGLMCDFCGTIQNLPTCATYVCAVAVGVCIVGAGAFWVARECARGGRKIAAASLVGAMLIGGMVVVGTDGAGTKPGTNDVSQVEGGTNTVAQVEGGTNQMENGELRIDNAGGDFSILRSPFPILHSSAALPGNIITGDDVERMFRVATTFDGNSFVEPTANAVTNAAWLDYGGMSDTFRLLPEGWRFPFAEKTTTGLTVFENGEFRPNVKTHFFPPPFDAKLSLLPRLNWGLLPNGGESVFWHEQTPSNSLVLTWHNALYNRDVSCPTNFQVELFADGRFDYRYPDRTVQYAPVFPFDWDGDGLENSVDPEPLVAGPDAHGTNAEWYNRVCGNVFSANEGADGIVVLAPRTSDVNTNAYYFVDVVVESLAPVYFTADGESMLGDPTVIAQAGETCHVPLLIGATYCVSSTVPFQVMAPVEAVVQMRTVPGTVGIVKWPVPVSFTTEDGWTRPSVPADLQRRLSGTFSWSNGCCMLVSGDAVSFQCHGCRCRGCDAYANYSYSGYHLTCPGPSCGCTGDYEAGNVPYVETPSGARLSVRFGKRALLFENGYDDSPGVTVARRSSLVSLTVDASGGSKGGTLSFSTRKFDRLFHAAGDSLPQSPILLAAGTNLSYSVTYEALARSDDVDDISFTACLEEGGTEPLRLDCTIRLTAIELSLTVDKRAPENACPHRHGYGVRELVKAEQRPTSPRVEWHAPDWIVTNGLPTSLVCPLVATNYGGMVKACLGDAEYTFDVSVYNPTGVFSRVGESEWYYRSRVPGLEIPLGISGTGMKVPVYVGPMDVSFEGIAISERPCETGQHTGYFDHPDEEENWSHTHARGAGGYYQVKTGNLWFSDEPCYFVVPNARPLSSGLLVWDDPIGWNEIGTVWWKDCVAEVPGNVKQIMILTSDGTMFLSKFGQWTMRTTNDWRVVNGVVVKEGR